MRNLLKRLRLFMVPLQSLNPCLRVGVYGNTCWSVWDILHWSLRPVAADSSEIPRSKGLQAKKSHFRLCSNLSPWSIIVYINIPVILCIFQPAEKVFNLIGMGDGMKNKKRARTVSNLNSPQLLRFSYWVNINEIGYLTSWGRHLFADREHCWYQNLQLTQI